jgi:hypothetical protein
LLGEYRQIKEESVNDDDYEGRRMELFDRIVRSLDEAP